MAKTVKVENSNIGAYKIGSRVWWFDAWDNLRWGDIYEIRSEKWGALDSVKIALIHENGKKGSNTGARLEECWPTKEQCLVAKKTEEQKHYRECLNYIKTVEDLVRFMYSTDLTSEFRDCMAEKAVKEKAKELLGISLED